MHFFITSSYYHNVLAFLNSKSAQVLLLFVVSYEPAETYEEY